MTADAPTADAPARPKRTATAELWVRSLGQPEAVDQQAELVDRLARLESAGVLDGVDVDVWGDRLILSAATVRTAPGRRFLTRYQRFQDWADRAGATLEPFFETTGTVSSFTGAEHTRLVFPVHTLSEFDGDEVVHVAPAVVDGEVRTVEDRLAVLEETADDGPVTADEDPATADPDRMDDPDRRVEDRPTMLVDPRARESPHSGRTE
jgi:hypothetical protein